MSNLKSPVCTTVPSGVWIAYPTPSGIEWLTRKGVIEEAPMVKVMPASTVRSGVDSRSLCSLSLPVTRPMVSRDA